MSRRIDYYWLDFKNKIINVHQYIDTIPSYKFDGSLDEVANFIKDLSEKYKVSKPVVLKDDYNDGSKEKEVIFNKIYLNQRDGYDGDIEYDIKGVRDPTPEELVVLNKQEDDRKVAAKAAKRLEYEKLKEEFEGD